MFDFNKEEIRNFSINQLMEIYQECDIKEFESILNAYKEELDVLELKLGLKKL